jgi:hypothetical protein
LPNAHLLLPSLMGFHRCGGSPCICSGRPKTSSAQSKDEQAATPSCVSGSRRRSRHDCLLCIDDAQTRNTATWTTHTTHHMDLPASIERMGLPCSKSTALESTATRSTHFAQPSRLPYSRVMCLTTCSLTTWPCACTSSYPRSWSRQRKRLCPCR